jgi:hypothetical protein
MDEWTRKWEAEIKSEATNHNIGDWQRRGCASDQVEHQLKKGGRSKNWAG